MTYFFILFGFPVCFFQAEFVLLSCGVLVVAIAALALVWCDKFYAIYAGLCFRSVESIFSV